MPKEINKPESGLWKDYINRDSIELFIDTLGKFHKRLDKKKALDTIVANGFFELELKDRIKNIAERIKMFLPSDYTQTIKILIKAAPSLNGFLNWVLTDFVRIHGQDKFDDSVYALKELTKYGTGEFAIRVYVNKDPDKMISVFHEWAADGNHHVRRLAAEGSRPRGVWVEHIDKFKKNPKPVLELLEKLKSDESLYVRKAVANNLNDISKDNPELVIKTALEWKKDRSKETNWIIKHACRSLIKQGHPDVFRLFDFTPEPKIRINGFKIKKKNIKINENVNIPITITSKSGKNQKLAIDYKIHYMKKNNSLSPKVFKLTEKKIAPSHRIELTLKHKFENHSTRIHHPGKHLIELIINGVLYDSIEVYLSI